MKSLLQLHVPKVCRHVTTLQSRSLAQNFRTVPSYNVSYMVPSPIVSALSKCYQNATSVDSFAIELPSDATNDPLVLSKTMLSYSSTWFNTLLTLRNTIMTNFGVKTSTEMMNSKPADKVIGFFPIESISQHEVIVAEKDIHLDFQGSVLVVAHPNDETRREIILTTVVHTHKLLGRRYLMAIMPFHLFIVKTFLEDAAKRGWPKK